MPLIRSFLLSLPITSSGAMTRSKKLRILSNDPPMLPLNRPGQSKKDFTYKAGPIKTPTSQIPTPSTQFRHQIPCRVPTSPTTNPPISHSNITEKPNKRPLPIVKPQASNVVSKVIFGSFKPQGSFTTDTTPSPQQSPHISPERTSTKSTTLEPSPSTMLIEALKEPPRNLHKEQLMSGLCGNEPPQKESTQTKNVQVESGQTSGQKECEQTIGQKESEQNSAKWAPNWLDSIKVKAKEEVKTIDHDGKIEKVKESVQPYEVDKMPAGVKFIVDFNNLNQPIRKGGSILVKYLGHVAKTERFFPLGSIRWKKVNKMNLKEVTELVRSKFEIPEGELFNSAILKHISKHWREYKHSLKKDRFKPDLYSIEQLYNDVPRGHNRDGWMTLVDYWYSEKGKVLAEKGKRARALHKHVHTTGATSYANKRHDYVKEKGREPSLVEFFDITHRAKDEKFIDDTRTQKFTDDVNSKVDKILNDFSSNKSRVEVEDEVFINLMHDDKVPKMPVGFGFGVKSSSVYGVHGALRKEQDTTYTNALEVRFANVTKQNEELKAKHMTLESKLDQTQELLHQILHGLQKGNGVGKDAIDAAQVMVHPCLHKNNAKVSDVSIGVGVQVESRDGGRGAYKDNVRDLQDIYSSTSSSDEDPL